MSCSCEKLKISAFLPFRERALRRDAGSLHAYPEVRSSVRPPVEADADHPVLVSAREDPAPASPPAASVPLTDGDPASAVAALEAAAAAAGQSGATLPTAAARQNPPAHIP